MNTIALAHLNYASSSSIKSPKDTEIEVILKTTRRLKAATKARKVDFSEFVASIQLNRKLWIMLGSDVAHVENALSSELRSQIFYLAEFVQDYSGKVLRDGLDSLPLIEINLAILRGLGGKKDHQ